MMIPDFEAYLKSKKIDSAAFKNAEPELWMAWKKEFEQMHPNSFTVQKLNLINPIRRKYQLPHVTVTTGPENTTPSTNSPVIPAAARQGKPLMKPKPKME